MNKKPELFLRWCGYTLEFSAESDGNLPVFPGSAFRGAFGHALKRLVCVMRHRPCCGCPLEMSCLYTTIFETRATINSVEAKRYDRPPLPFVLKVSFQSERKFYKGSKLLMGINLYGKSMAASPFILRAIEEAGKYGLGSSRLPFKLENIYIEGKNENWKPGQKYPKHFAMGEPKVSTANIQWRLTTPMRLRSGGKPVDHNKLRPQDIAMPVFRRLVLLTQHYGEPNHFIVSESMKQSAGLLRFTNLDLHWKTLQRYSSRQSSTHSVSGLIGTLGLDYSKAPEWGPILAWAPIIHIGKGTSMGLGRIEVIK